MQYMKVERLKKLRSHVEYGGKIIGQMTQDDLAHDCELHGSFSDLKADIEANGILNPLIIDKYASGEMTLGNGHHRALIAMELDMAYVPVEIRG